MNHSMYSADRRTHLKIVVIGLLCATIVAAVGIFASVSDVDLGTAPLVKAGQPTALSGGCRPSGNCRHARLVPASRLLGSSKRDGRDKARP